MYCEDRTTYTCHPSYTTIGSAIGMSKRTVMKYVQILERKGLIETEPTTVTNHEGKNWNGNLKYKILPIGHYSVAFTLDVYGHVTDDMKRDAADKVSGVLKGAV